MKKKYQSPSAQLWGITQTDVITASPYNNDEDVTKREPDWGDDNWDI